MKAVPVHCAGICIFVITWLLTLPLGQARPMLGAPPVQQRPPQTNGRAAIGIRCQLQAEGRKCVVRGITQSGPAAGAGIRNGDVILPLDNADSSNVVEQIKKLSPGSKATIRFKRGGSLKQVTLTVADELAISLRGGELKDPVAETDLAEIYENGEGVPRDYSQAQKWYERAAADGFDDAALSLGRMFFEGKGTPKDDKAAVSWYRKAAEHGNVAAEAALGWMYVEGRGVAKDPTAAMYWYRKAAAQGDAESEASVGDAYERGFGVPQDQQQAAQWFQKAAEAGIPFAQTELAIMYSKGTGVPSDQTIAMNWLRKAAAQNFAAAEYDLGVVYETGIGVPKDLNTAKTWYKKAADHGYADAKARLEQLKQ